MAEGQDRSGNAAGGGDVTPPPAPDLITAANVTLAAARSADSEEVAGYYLGLARLHLDKLSEALGQLKSSFAHVEAELIRRGRPNATPLTGGPSTEPDGRG